jgi:hypothetical protein
MLYLHMHDPPILHRDLKSPNLLVDSHWGVKVRAALADARRLESCVLICSPCASCSAGATQMALGRLGGPGAAAPCHCHRRRPPPLRVSRAAWHPASQPATHWRTPPPTPTPPPGVRLQPVPHHRGDGGVRQLHGRHEPAVAGARGAGRQRAQPRLGRLRLWGGAVGGEPAAAVAVLRRLGGGGGGGVARRVAGAAQPAARVCRGGRRLGVRCLRFAMRRLTLAACPLVTAAAAGLGHSLGIRKPLEGARSSPARPGQAGSPGKRAVDPRGAAQPGAAPQAPAAPPPTPPHPPTHPPPPPHTHTHTRTPTLRPARRLCRQSWQASGCPSRRCTSCPAPAPRPSAAWGGTFRWWRRAGRRTRRRGPPSWRQSTG